MDLNWGIKVLEKGSEFMGGIINSSLESKEKNN
jgi:hypothetical protein